LQNADVILALGTSLGYKTTGFSLETFAPDAFIIDVDIDENEAKKPGLHIDCFMHADLTAFFDAVKSHTKKVPVDDDWLDYCDKLKNRFSPFEAAENVTKDERVSAYYFWKEYERYEPKKGISALGNNTANSAKLQVGVKSPEQRIVTNINWGTMGADLPEAIGAAVASGLPVVCLTGDGSIMMNLQELQTIRHYDLPVKIVVFSNDGYNAMRQTNKNFFNGLNIGSDSKTGISFPDFKDIANTFGFKYRSCKCNAEVDAALEWLFQTNGRSLLEVMQRLDDPVTPKVMSKMSEDGTMQSPRLQDMFPFLDEDEQKSFEIVVDS
jgi:acetolactate synthase-1/2/3 large subunit